MTRSIALAVVPGDCVGPEVTAEALKVLRCASDQYDFILYETEFDIGAQRYKRTGEVLPDAVLDELRTHDAILLGAVGHPTVAPGILERGLMVRMRQKFNQYVNLRPVKLFTQGNSPLRDPGEIDFVVVREGVEGPYSGNGGVLREGTEDELATEVSLNTARGIRGLIRYAFEEAQARPRKKLTLVHKKNVLVYAGPLWVRLIDEINADYPDVTTDYCHTDAATIYMVTDPGRFDVIVTDNLFGDIITDLSAAVTGGIGLAASGCINPERTAPSMFEPVHGSAPDIAGKQKADPTAAILSAAMLLEHLGVDDAAQAIRHAAETDAAERNGFRPTKVVGDDIASRIMSAEGS